MDQELRLRAHASAIGPATDYTYKWGLNVGLSMNKARRLALAVDELVTDVVRYAYPTADEEFRIAFRDDLTTAEVIIREEGTPFDPAEVAYDRERAVEKGAFDGAGYAVVEHCVDEVRFLERGSVDENAGKEFRLVQHIEAEHIRDRAPADLVQPPDPDRRDGKVEYALEPVTPDDAADVSKLIYRTYGDTYSKEELYYPERIAQALRNEEKFGVVVRTDRGAIVGYFAVLRTDDSSIGEVGEAVVDPNHRRRGLMTRMLEWLIEQAQAEDLIGVFGEPVTAHEISQRANARFNFVTTALNLAFQPPEQFTGLLETYLQPISNLIDFKPLVPYDTVQPHLPPPYADLLREIYDALGASVEVPRDRADTLPAGALLDARIQYDFQHAVLVVERPGADVLEQAKQMLHDLSGTDLNALYIDLPLHSPHTPALTNTLRDGGFVFAGLAPRFHHDRDHLRLQRPLVDLDLNEIVVYSDLAYRLKDKIADELQWSTSATATP